MAALAFNDMGERTGGPAEPGRGCCAQPGPARQSLRSSGQSRQLSKGISPAFKTCLGSSKEREQFSSMGRGRINTAASIVFITGLQLIWCLLLFCCCSAPVALAASRLGQRQSRASLRQSSDLLGQGISGCVYVQTPSSLTAARELWEGCGTQAKPDPQRIERAMLCALTTPQTYMFTRLKKCFAWDSPLLVFAPEGLRGPPRRGALPSSLPSAA